MVVVRAVKNLLTGTLGAAASLSASFDVGTEASTPFLLSGPADSALISGFTAEFVPYNFNMIHELYKNKISQRSKVFNQ